MHHIVRQNVNCSISSRQPRRLAVTWPSGSWILVWEHGSTRHNIRRSKHTQLFHYTSIHNVNINTCGLQNSRGSPSHDIRTTANQDSSTESTKETQETNNATVWNKRKPECHISCNIEGPRPAAQSRHRTVCCCKSLSWLLLEIWYLSAELKIMFSCTCGNAGLEFISRVAIFKRWDRNILRV